MDPPLPPPPTAKLRLMCSYGGHIVPRPRTNSLCYAGGDTRIVSFHRHSLTNLSSFLSHLSSTLSLNFPFTLKYQLPHLDLHSLVTLSSDEDLHILIDEHNRLSSSPSPVPSRIRVFVFPTNNPDSGRPVIRHPKTESWFFDALKNAKIMHKGMEGETQEYCSGELTRTFVSSAPAESMVLETSSSFGSTSSSASSTNLPPLRAQGDDNDAVLKDVNKEKNAALGWRNGANKLIDNTVSTSIMSQQQSIPYKDPVAYVSEARVNAEFVEVENKIPNITSEAISNDTNMDPGYTSFPLFNQVERSHLQFVQAASHFLPLRPSGLLPVPSYQHFYQQPQPLQHLVYQPCPLYLVPIGNMPPNSLPITASSQASVVSNASFMNYHVAHNSERGARSPFARDFTSQNYLTDNATASFVQVPYEASHQREMDIYPMHHQCQNISMTSRESPKYGSELDVDGDLAHVQIYKSQPPPPTLPSKYQSMTKATTNLLSEAFAQLHVDNLKLQTETSRPQ